MAFHAEERLSGLVFGLFSLQIISISIEKERLMKSIIPLFSMRSLLLTILLLRPLFVLLMRLRLGVLMRRLRILRDGLIMYLRSILLILVILFVADDFILVAKDLLLGLKQLQVGRGGLRDLVVIFDLEFVGHYLNYICQLCTIGMIGGKGILGFELLFIVKKLDHFKGCSATARISRVVRKALRA